MSIIQVSGPPCSGKSTHIRNNTKPGDTILDDNTELAEPAGGRDHITDTQWRAWHQHLDHTIATHTGPGTLWYIQGNPTPRAPNVTVHLMNTTADECHTRATNDHRPPITHAWIDKWFTKYGGKSRAW